jgi:putative redox protein
MGKPPAVASLTWTGDLRFTASSGDATITIDGDSVAGASPVQTLAISLAGCMAADVVDILTKGRHPLTGFDARLEAERAEKPPRRFTRVNLHFLIRGEVPDQAIKRAIGLSRDTYCSVWHSMRQDIEFATSFEVRP